MRTDVAIIGAGPAGLTAAYLLSKNDVRVTVLEADPVYVGGISKTATYKGFGFDIGGHRFFSKCKAVEDIWTEILPNDMLVRPRSSRIFYGGKFFTYPLKPFEALFKLGIVVRPFASSRGSKPASSQCAIHKFRRLGQQSVWETALPDVFQELYRKGLGNELPGDFGGLGGATNQRPFARERHPNALCRNASRGRNQSDQDADQFLQLST